MLKTLLATDGSASALRAATCMAGRAADRELHLINVQPPLRGNAARYIDAAQLEQYHHEEGAKALDATAALLDKAGMAYQRHLFVGEPADIITRFAREQGFDEIAIGTRGHSAFSGLLLGSVAARVIHLSEVPVLLIK